MKIEQDDKPRKKAYEVEILVRGPRYCRDTYRVEAYSKAHALWIMLEWIQRHTDMGWSDFDFSAVKESGGRR